MAIVGCDDDHIEHDADIPDTIVSDGDMETDSDIEEARRYVHWEGTATLSIDDIEYVVDTEESYSIRSDGAIEFHLFGTVIVHEVFIHITIRLNNGFEIGEWDTSDPNLTISVETSWTCGSDTANGYASVHNIPYGETDYLDFNVQVENDACSLEAIGTAGNTPLD